MTQRRRADPCRRSGLSLFELLIALALLALLTAGLAAALNIGTSLYSRTANIGALAEEIAMRSRLRRWLSAATPPAVLAPFPTAFGGNLSAFEFITLVDTPFAPEAAALHVSVAFLGKSLTLTATTIGDDGESLTRYEHILARDIEQVEIAYFDALAEPPVWQDHWNDTTRLPDLVRITAAPGSTPEWPEFTVRPQLR